jgi:epoxide hydrolase-like predicted phosphatase
MGRGLILDFGGVVTSDFHAALSAFCTREGLPPDAVSGALRDTTVGRHALAAAESGRIGQREFEATLAGLIGADHRGLLTRALADLRPRGPVLDLVERVRACGIPVAVLSNSLGRGGYNLYQGYDLDNRFDAVVISDQVGLRKPDPAIYRLATARIGVPTSSCVFADDTEANLDPARALGMAAVHFTNAAPGLAEIEHLLTSRTVLELARIGVSGSPPIAIARAGLARVAVLGLGLLTGVADDGGLEYRQ